MLFPSGSATESPCLFFFFFNYGLSAAFYFDFLNKFVYLNWRLIKVHFLSLPACKCSGLPLPLWNHSDLFLVSHCLLFDSDHPASLF